MINPFSSLFARVSPSASSDSPSAAKPESAPKSSPSSAAPSSYFKDEFDLGKSKYWSDMQAGARRGPAEEAAGAPVVSTQNGRTHVQLGAGNDQVQIAQRNDGGMDITVNGRVTSLTPEQVRAGVTVDCGAGNDHVRIANGVTADLEVHGGDGNDTLIGGAGNDVLDGGDGHDYLEGGAGNDVMRGGAGNDTMYGLDGDDEMDGGDGNDYMDGGAGNDRLNGGRGNDVLFGGRGNDTLNGGEGDDVLAGGEGRDTLDGGAGTDRLFSQEEDTIQNAEGDTNTRVDMSQNVGTSVTVTGNADFQTRVQSDLDAMRSIPTGRQMLRELDATGHTTTIASTNGGNEAGATNWDDAVRRPDGRPGRGSNAEVSYNTTRNILDTSEDWMIRPPMIGLFHELVHANQFATGTMPTGETNRVDNAELDAVGLPWDHDNNPRTPPQASGRVNENQMRSELGLPLRPRY